MLYSIMGMSHEERGKVRELKKTKKGTFKLYMIRVLYICAWLLILNIGWMLFGGLLKLEPYWIGWFSESVGAKLHETIYIVFAGSAFGGFVWLFALMPVWVALLFRWS